jgi:hypothetical protein
MSWIDFLIGMLWGASIMGWVLLKNYKVERKHPYSWLCPRDDCEFRVSSNIDPVSVNLIADRHLQHHDYQEN